MNDNEFNLADLLHGAETGDLERVRNNLEAVNTVRTGVVSKIHTTHALLWACENGHIEVAKYLLEQGADIHAEREIVLRFALQTGNLEMATFLIENGADIHLIKESSLILAAKIANYPTIRYLLALGTDPKLDFRQATEEVRVWIDQYINSSNLNDKLQNSLAEKPDKPASEFNDGKI